MANIDHHGTTIRFICDQLWQTVFDEIGDVEDDRAARLRKAVVPIVPGASIVLAVSYVERIFYELKKSVPPSGQPKSPLIPGVGELRNIQSHFGLDPAWCGWQELPLLMDIRLLGSIPSPGIWARVDIASVAQIHHL